MTSDLASLEVGQGGAPRRRVKKARSRHPGLTSRRPPASPRVDLIDLIWILLFFRKKLLPLRTGFDFAMPCHAEAKREGVCSGHPSGRRRQVVEKSSIFFPPLLPFVESTKSSRRDPPRPFEEGRPDHDGTTPSCIGFVEAK
jgi:hypothetical protein